MCVLLHLLFAFKIVDQSDATHIRKGEGGVLLANLKQLNDGFVFFFFNSSVGLLF